MKKFRVRFWTGRVNGYGEPAIGHSTEHDVYLCAENTDALWRHLIEQFKDLITVTTCIDVTLVDPEAS